MKAKRVLVIGSDFRQWQTSLQLPECEIVPFDESDDYTLPADLDAIIIWCDDGSSLSAAWRFRQFPQPVYLLNGQRPQIVHQIRRDSNRPTWLDIYAYQLRSQLSLRQPVCSYRPLF